MFSSAWKEKVSDQTDRYTFRHDVQAPGADPSINAGHKQKVLLDENDEIWTELRHQHIAVVTKCVEDVKNRSV